MKEMSATEVARNFSAVLDSVENGETIVITRGGHQLAKLVPTPRANGAALAEVLRKWQGQDVFGPEFDETVAWARSLPADQDGDPWHE